MLKKILPAAALMLVAAAAQADTLTAYALIRSGINQWDGAYNAWQAEGFTAAAETFQAAMAEDPENPWVYYWQGAAFFQLASFYLFARQEDRNLRGGEHALDEGLRVLTQAVEKAPDLSESYALRGVMRGMKIKLNAWNVFSQGLALQADRDQAFKLNAENPRAHYLAGLSVWMSPEFFGGGAKQALEYLFRAENLFTAEASQNKQPWEPTWGYSTCLSFIGDIYAAQAQRPAAEEYYRKALLVNPNDPRALEGLKNLGPADAEGDEP